MFQKIYNCYFCFKAGGNYVYWEQKKKESQISLGDGIL